MIIASSDDTPSLLHVMKQFAIEGMMMKVNKIPTGLINTTYRATYQSENQTRRDYIFQSLNQSVFKEPKAVMENIQIVTNHLKSKASQGSQYLELIPTLENKHSFTDVQTQALWRCYPAIRNAVTYDRAPSAEIAYQAAFGFGSFQADVFDLDANLLQETIPFFHHTRRRYDRLMQVAREDTLGLRKQCLPELAKIHGRENIVNRLLDLESNGQIQKRIIHNDTKLNNVMMDAHANRAVCVIDLDTVMPGLALYDFGDLVRSACNVSDEDEQDLEQVYFHQAYYEAIQDGYLAALGNKIQPVEKGLLLHSAKLMTLELSIRFLTDHLEGSIYFKTAKTNQNLDRARNQLHLLEQMEAFEDRL